MAETTIVGRIHKLHSTDASLDPWPIPEDQILSGTPNARGTIMWQSDDKRLANGIWECAPCSFTWEYTWDETIYLIEGRIRITDETGSTTEVVPGDLIFVPAGTKSTWVITEHVRKAYHFKSETPVEL